MPASAYQPFNFPAASSGRSTSTASPTAGADVFGSRPQPVAMPDPYEDLSRVYPNLSGTNAQVSSDVLSQLRGELSPETVNAIRDSAATFGVSSGMPGSGLAGASGLRNLGLTMQGVQQQGLQNYGSLVPVISGTQTVRPETQADINTQNAVWAAAPDPVAAGNYAQQLFDRYLQQQSGGPAGGTSGSGDSGSWHGSQAPVQTYYTYYGPNGIPMGPPHRVS